MNDEEQYRDFVITCDHGITEGQPEMLARYEWIDVRGVWEPHPDCKVQREEDPRNRRPGVTVTYLEGEREGLHRPDEANNEPLRVHHDIHCEYNCRIRGLRIPDEHLQMVFGVVAVSPAQSFKRFREEAALIRGGEMTVTLVALHAARGEVARYGLLRQLA